MIITWHKQLYFKIKSKTLQEIELNIAPSEQAKKISGDVILNNNPKIKFITDNKDTFVINNAGEYEIKNIFIIGIKVKTADSFTVIYRLELENISLAHLGTINQPLNNDVLEKLGNIDILMLPVGKNMNNKDAANIISDIEPKIVVPMNYPGDENDELIKNFAKEMGASAEEAIDKFKTSAKDITGDKTKIIVLKPAS